MAKSGRITPTTRGAAVSTQGRKKTMPWTAPAPSSLRDPSNIYSQPEDVVRTGRRPVGDVTAAVARMRGFQQPDDLDGLGESTFGLGHEVDNGQNGSNQDADANQNQNPDPSRFVAVEDVQGMIEKALREFAVISQTRVQQPSAPAPAPKSQPQSELIANFVTAEDTDRLWDWIRQSPVSAQSFLSLVPGTSLQLHNIMKNLADAEQQGIAIIRAIHLVHADGSDEHLGFGMLAPILGADKLAVVHLYLSPQRRGNVAQLAPALIDLTAKHLPGFKFAIVPSDAVQLRLYGQVLTPLGFTTHTIFVR